MPLLLCSAAQRMCEAQQQQQQQQQASPATKQAAAPRFTHFAFTSCTLPRTAARLWGSKSASLPLLLLLLLLLLPSSRSAALAAASCAASTAEPGCWLAACSPSAVCR